MNCLLVCENSVVVLFMVVVMLFISLNWLFCGVLLSIRLFIGLLWLGMVIWLFMLVWLIVLFFLCSNCMVLCMCLSMIEWVIENRFCRVLVCWLMVVDVFVFMWLVLVVVRISVVVMIMVSIRVSMGSSR